MCGMFIGPHSQAGQNTFTGRLFMKRRSHDTRPCAEGGRKAASDPEANEPPAIPRNGARKRSGEQAAVAAADHVRVPSRSDPRPYPS
jgi:hypothetical protein